MSLTLNNDLNNLKVGDYFWCKYTASSGEIGVFSDIATKTDEEVTGLEIPTSSSTTPNGFFKYIVVEKYNGKTICIANVNIQNSISWDSINSQGYSSGNTVDLGLEGYEFTVRLMSGGVNDQDFDNEWDNYIVNSSLNGSITPGDADFWNLYPESVNYFSWTSSTDKDYTSDRRIIRSKLYKDQSNYYGRYTTSTTSVTTTFRPLLEIESLQAPPIKKYLIEDEGEIKTLKESEWTSLGSQASEELFLSEGMDSLDGLFQEKTSLVTPFTEEGELGEGKVYKATLNLKGVKINQRGEVK